MSDSSKKEVMVSYDEFQEIVERCRENAGKYDPDKIVIENKDFAAITEEVCDWLYAENLSNIEFRDCLLDGVNFVHCDLSFANFIDCSMIECIFSTSTLTYAQFKSCDLSRSTFDESQLIRTSINASKLEDVKFLNNNIVSIDLSESTGLKSSIDFLEENFEKTEEGYIAYKIFNLHYMKPESWEIKEGSILTEVVNTSRFEECSCGINVGTRKLMEEYSSYPIWKVLIRFEWLSEVCVPYNSNQKIRCGRIQLLEKVQEGDETGLERCRKNRPMALKN